MLKWTGAGFLAGVPARDLEEDELEQYGGRQALLDSGLYVDEKPAKMVMPKKAKMTLEEEKE